MNLCSQNSQYYQLLTLLLAVSTVFFNDFGCNFLYFYCPRAKPLAGTHGTLRLKTTVITQYKQSIGKLQLPGLGLIFIECVCIVDMVRAKLSNVLHTQKDRHTNQLISKKQLTCISTTKKWCSYGQQQTPTTSVWYDNNHNK